MTGVGQPRLNFVDDARAGGVDGYFALHGGGNGDLENAFGEEQGDANHAFGASLLRGETDALPVKLGMAMDDSGNVGDPHQAFPEMFCAVNGDEDELVFEREGRDAAAVDGYEREALKEIFDRKRAREIAQRTFRVQFDQRGGERAAERVLAGSFLRANGG